MLEETTPRTSAKWRPHDTFAQQMGKVGGGYVEGTNGANVEKLA